MAASTRRTQPRTRPITRLLTGLGRALWVGGLTCWPAVDGTAQAQTAGPITTIAPRPHYRTDVRTPVIVRGQGEASASIQLPPSFSMPGGSPGQLLPPTGTPLGQSLTESALPSFAGATGVPPTMPLGSKPPTMPIPGGRKTLLSDRSPRTAPTMPVLHAAGGAERPAYGWYGYGAPTPTVTPFGSQPANQVQAPWYQSTGATPGAFPESSRVVVNYQPTPNIDTLSPAAYQAEPLGPTPVGTAPGLTQAGFASVAEPRAKASEYSTAKESLPPSVPNTPIAMPTTPPVHPTMPSAVPGQPMSPGPAAQFDRDYPPPPQGIRWTPVRSPTTTPTSAPSPQPIATSEPTPPKLVAPPLKPTSQARPAAQLGIPTAMAAQQPRYVARAQDDSGDEAPLPTVAPAVVQRVVAAAGNDAFDISVRAVAAGRLTIRLTVTDARIAEAIVNRIAALPELRRAAVDFEVVVR